MKSVLVVDATPAFSDFLKEKISEQKIDVSFIQDKMDSIPRMVSLFPELVIVEVHDDEIAFFSEYMQKIKADPNASRIPLVAVGPVIDKQYLALFIKLGVLKYFIKPLKFDSFFEGIGSILQTIFPADKTQCVLNLHKNGNIIMIEVALGLNREKLSTLHYKLTEMIDSSGMEIPKIILMISNMDLTFVDAINIEYLMENILLNHRILPKNIKVLTSSKFVKDLLEGHTEYTEIEAASDISQFANFLTEGAITSNMPELISEKLLSTDEGDASHAEIRFVSDEITPSRSTVTGNGFDPYLIHIAIVDNNSVVLDLLSGSFRAKRFHVDNFSNSATFMETIIEKKYDLVIIDVLMPGLSGIDIMKKIKQLPEVPPIFIHSQATNREIIAKVLSLGAKQFFVKPQKPEVIVQKSIDFLTGVKQFSLKR